MEKNKRFYSGDKVVVVKHVELSGGEFIPEGTVLECISDNNGKYAEFLYGQRHTYVQKDCVELYEEKETEMNEPFVKGNKYIITQVVKLPSGDDLFEGEELEYIGEHSLDFGRFLYKGKQYVLLYNYIRPFVIPEEYYEGYTSEYDGCETTDSISEIVNAFLDTIIPDENSSLIPVEMPVNVSFVNNDKGFSLVLNKRIDNDQLQAILDIVL